MLGRSAEIAQPALNWSPNRTHTHTHEGWKVGARRDEACVEEKKKKNLQKDLFRMEKILYNIKTNQSRLCALTFE